MPIIKLTTEINNANVEIVFDLIRSIDLHKIAAHKSKAATIAGLISLNETVTWKAKHLGFTQELTSKITDYIYPTFLLMKWSKVLLKVFDTHIILSKKRTM